MELSQAFFHPRAAGWAGEANAVSEQEGRGCTDWTSLQETQGPSLSAPDSGHVAAPSWASVSPC